MKKILTILTLIICIYANAQRQLPVDKVNSNLKELVEVQTIFNEQLNVELVNLQKEVIALKKEVADLKQGIDLNELIEVLQVKSFTDNKDLPKDLAPDEIGVAFVKKENEATQLYISINNQWTILRL